MVNNASDQSLTPPRFAAALVSITALSQDKDVLIGDLAEEFHSLSQNSVQGAERWYWRQTARSLPQLMMTRLRTDAFRRFVVTVMAAIGAFLMVRVWDIYVARNAAGAFHQMIDAQTFGPARIMYFTVQTFGFALAGAAIAMTTFEKGQPFMKNALYRLGPAAIILFAPFIFYIVTASDDYPVVTRYIQLGLAVPSYILGALAAVRLGAGGVR